MKERILRVLYKLSVSRDHETLNKLVQETGYSVLRIEENARLALSGLLHDYDRFSVSTIDSFFQKVLRSFARETGLFGSYEIELDQNAMLEEACDRLLLSIEEDEELRLWLMAMSEDQLIEGKSWSVNKKILSLGKEIFNESFQPYLLNQESTETERAKLKSLREELQKTRSWYEKECIHYGEKALALISRFEIELDDFKYKRSSFANTFYKLAQYSGGEIILGARFLNAIDAVENWSAKDKLPQMQALYDAGLNKLMHDIVSFLNEHSKKYTTAFEVQKQVYALGVLSALAVKVREIGYERNSILLSEGNTLLRGIIGQNDAPFVYEKTGTYYQFFMIDEFQDTSTTQWANFKPLINNSLAENHANLVVGDVKQSIYRWRNSDWQLLDKQIKLDLAQYKPDEISMDVNWRSSRNVVQYNNLFFNMAKGLLQSSYNESLETESSPVIDEYRNTILNAYADSEQQSLSNIDGGIVQCAFISNNEAQSYEEVTVHQVIQTVKHVQDQGYSASDIAILVKKNKQGKMIADALLAEKNNGDHYNFEVISDDTLFVESSASVRFLIGLLKYVLTPADQVVKATVVYEFANNLLPLLSEMGRTPERFISEGQQALSFQAQDNGKFRLIPNELRSEFFPFFDDDKMRSLSQRWAYLSLIDLIEELILRYNLHYLSGDQANLQALKDLANDFSKRESGNLHKFIDWWDQFGAGVKLQTAKERDAIKIMSIHKSKGLEFSIVLLPFCDWNFQPDSTKLNILWCSTSHTAYQQFPILPVNFTGRLKNSDFANDYYTELLLSYIDNLNLLYVAQTRAINGLYIFTEETTKDTANSVAQLYHQFFRNSASDIEYQTENEVVFTIGQLSLGTKKENEQVNEANLSGSFKRHKNINNSLKLKRNYIDFLDDAESTRSVQINRGKLMHEILSLISESSDIDNAVQKVQLSGKISSTESENLKEEIKVLINHPEVKEWFSGKYKVLNEQTIVLPKFDLPRPDRLMIEGNRILVVDYKTTNIENTSHQRQVKTYMKYLIQMGYDKVEGYIYYLTSKKLSEVKYDD